MIKVFAWLIRDLHLKIIAILVAIGFWVYVSLDRVYTTSLELPIKTTNLSENLIITSDLPNIMVTFLGKGREILKLKIKPPSLLLNLANAQRGKNIVPVSTNNMLTTDADVEKIKTSLKAIEILIDERYEKQLAPTIVTQGEPREGFALKEIVSAGKVKITGPKGQVQYIQDLATEPLSLHNRSADFTRLLALSIPERKNVTLSPCSIFVRVLIEEYIERVFIDVPVHKILPRGVSARFEPVVIESLVLSGPKSLLAEYSIEDFSITIDLRGKKAGNYMLPAEIRLPKNLKLVNSKPKFFNVSVR